MFPGRVRKRAQFHANDFVSEKVKQPYGIIYGIQRSIIRFINFGKRTKRRGENGQIKERKKKTSRLTDDSAPRKKEIQFKYFITT